VQTYQHVFEVSAADRLGEGALLAVVVELAARYVLADDVGDLLGLALFIRVGCLLFNLVHLYQDWAIKFLSLLELFLAKFQEPSCVGVAQVKDFDCTNFIVLIPCDFALGTES
jgi:hypothetical protein